MSKIDELANQIAQEMDFPYDYDLSTFARRAIVRAASAPLRRTMRS